MEAVEKILMVSRRKAACRTTATSPSAHGFAVAQDEVATYCLLPTL